jgi:erythrocyte band 7 integral membrane protein
MLDLTVVLIRLPCVDNVFIADLRTQTFDIPPQEILTKDSVTATVDAVVYIKVTDPTISIVEVENAPYATRVLAATALRNVFGTKTLQEILSDRNSIDNILKEILDNITNRWGVSVERVEMYSFLFRSTKLDILS